MKKTFSLLLVCLIGTGIAFSQPNNEKVIEISNPGQLSVQWEKQSIDMGTLAYKNPSEAIFVLKNTGEVPVIINRVQGSCGCQNIEYPKAPVKPNQSIEIKITYNAASKGRFHKSARVYIKDDVTVHHLSMKGTVE